MSKVVYVLMLTQWCLLPPGAPKKESIIFTITTHFSLFATNVKAHSGVASYKESS